MRESPCEGDFLATLQRQVGELGPISTRTSGGRLSCRMKSSGNEGEKHGGLMHPPLGMILASCKPSSLALGKLRIPPHSGKNKIGLSKENEGSKLDGRGENRLLDPHIYNAVGLSTF